MLKLRQVDSEIQCPLLEKDANLDEQLWNKDDMTKDIEVKFNEIDIENGQKVTKMSESKLDTEGDSKLAKKDPNYMAMLCPPIIFVGRGG